MRFKQFIAERLENGSVDFYGKPLSADAAIAWMQDNSKEYLQRVKSEAALPIFRGLMLFDDSQLVEYKNTNDFERTSANTYNFYTLWIDNESSWRGFPKRSKSFICSTVKAYAETYGHLHFIIPNDNAKIGICPEEDMWTSFGMVNPRYHDMSDFIDSVAFALMSQNYDPDIVGKDWQMMKECFSEITLEVLNNTPGWKKYGHTWTVPLEAMLQQYGNDTNLYELFKILLDPTKNGFTKCLAKDLAKPKHREIWVQGETLIISIDELRGKSDDAKKLNDFLKTYGITR